MKHFLFSVHWLMNCRSGHCRDSFINLRLYPRFMEWCLIKPHTYKMFFAKTGNDYRILMSSETNESAAHTWPLLALSCITVITPYKLDLCVSLRWEPSFTYFHPDAVHIPTLYLLPLPSLFHSLSIFLTGLRSHLLYRQPPRFPYCLWHQVQSKNWGIQWVKLCLCCQTDLSHSLYPCLAQRYTHMVN